MHPLAIGFWGAFFDAVGLMLLGAAAARRAPADQAALAAPAVVVGKVRDMSRTAWSFASRVAWHDQASERIAEVPALDTA